MKIEALQDKKVAVLGLGVEGLATAEYFLSHHIDFEVIDEKSEADLEALGEEWGRVLSLLKEEGVVLHLGTSLTQIPWETYEVVVRSPGISPFKEFLKNFSGELTSQTKLFFDNCPAKIIGVTGTKGKGTTTTLIYEMLKKAGFDAYLGGNIGKPPFVFLDALTEKSFAVLELSSFQLQDLEKSPAIAVMLMVTQEHLDYHSSIEEYREAKRNILKWQSADDMAVLNTDYPATRGSASQTPAKIAWVSRYQETENGCFVRDNKVILRVSSLGPAARQPQKVHRSHPFTAETFQGSPVRVTPSNFFEYEVIDISEILLPGAHNLENVCAAAMAAYHAGVSIADIAFVLKTFKGLDHRLELVRVVNGVRYYDDSFSTVPETSIAAISAFTEPEILILGGSSKHSDFTELGRIISEVSNIKAIIGIGVEWEQIKLKIKNEKLKMIEGCTTMAEVIAKAQEEAQPGDIVLLSPACASFDMFKNYKDRGDQFKHAVNML